MEKITRLKLCYDIEKRGTNMIDIKCHILSLKSKWIRKYLVIIMLALGKKSKLYA